MDRTFDLPDSTDWLNTPLSLLAPLESSLRCQVCKDFFDNPVITTCSHTFCSICIRRCLSAEGKCPACRSSDQELKLRRNWAVQEVVEAFKMARPNVLDLARRSVTTAAAAIHDNASDDDGVAAEGQPASKKRKVQYGENQEDGISRDGCLSGTRQTRSQSKRVDGQTQTATVETVEDSQDEDFEPPDDGLVACPICNRRMKNEAVFQHLDTCQGPLDPPKQSNFGSLQTQSQPHASRSPQKEIRSTDKPPDRLPAINYSILKEGVLRRKLRDLGIPDWGPKPLLQRRHTEWMNLWNANCDSKMPKSKRELLRELDIWERTQGGHAPSASVGGTATTVMRKDFDTAAWSASHDDDFKRLIANARHRSDAIIRSTIPQSAPASTGVAAPLAGEPETSSAQQPEEPTEESRDMEILAHPIPDQDASSHGENGEVS